MYLTIKWVALLKTRVKWNEMPLLGFYRFRVRARRQNQTENIITLKKMSESTNRVDVACLGALPLKLVKMLNISTEFIAAERIVPCHFSIALEGHLFHYITITRTSYNPKYFSIFESFLMNCRTYPSSPEFVVLGINKLLDRWDLSPSAIFLEMSWKQKPLPLNFLFLN